MSKVETIYQSACEDMDLLIFKLEHMIKEMDKQGEAGGKFSLAARGVTLGLIEDIQRAKRTYADYREEFI